MKSNDSKSETKKKLLEKNREQLEKDVDKLPLARKVSDIVPPEGNPDALIMFIGEAAGYHEHLRRRPFVGVAGKLLTKSLEEIGIKRDEVWISNVLKVRPPGNRDPLPKEIESYRPFLDEEINIIRPKIVVTLGRFSMAKFIHDSYISKVHGQARWVDWEGKRILIFPMYHPAAALRNSQILTVFKEDFLKLANIITTLTNQSNGENQIQQAQLEKENNKQDNKEQQLQLI